MLISVKLLTKYVIITYATEKFGVCIKAFLRRSKGEIPDRASSQNERMSLEIEKGVPNWFRRRTFHVLHVLNSMY